MEIASPPLNRSHGRYVATPPFVERTYAEPDEDVLLAAMRIAVGIRPRLAAKRKGS